MTKPRAYARLFGPGGGGSSLLGLPAEECGHVQVVGRNILADIADVIRLGVCKCKPRTPIRLGVCKYKPRTPLLVNDVRQRLLHRRLIHDFAAGLPSFWQERFLLMDVFLIDVLEAGGMTVIFTESFILSS